jgi:hypothetical protein
MAFRIEEKSQCLDGIGRGGAVQNVKNAKGHGRGLYGSARGCAEVISDHE